MKKLYFVILTLGFFTTKLWATEMIVCDLSVNGKIIRTESAELGNARNVQLDLGIYSKYHFGGGVSGAYKYAWYWWDEQELSSLDKKEFLTDPAVSIAITETGDEIKASCDLFNR